MTGIKSIAPSYAGLSGAQQATVDSLLLGKQWDAAAVKYYVGSSNALALDTEFSSRFHPDFSGQPDKTFKFTSSLASAASAFNSVVDLQLTKTSSAGSATLVVVSGNASGIEGFFTFPGTAQTPKSTAGAPDYWSLGAFTNNSTKMNAAPQQKGDGAYVNWTLLHELGHSMGLVHSFRHKHTSTPDKYLPLPGLGATLDNERYTVMSYSGASKAGGFGHAVSYMALDVAALQAIYGADKHWANDNSSYRLAGPGVAALRLNEDDVSIGRAYYCIWDGGGKSDTITGSSNTGSCINLNAATLDRSATSTALSDLLTELTGTDFYSHLTSSLQSEMTDRNHYAGGFFSRLLVADKNNKLGGMDGGYSIAHGAVIENATGGSKGDLLIGNEAANTLRGNGGNDLLLGGAGKDTLIGGAGNDELHGGGAVDSLAGGQGNDSLYGGDGDDLLKGEGGSDQFIFNRESGLDTIADFHGSFNTATVSERDHIVVDTSVLGGDKASFEVVTSGPMPDAATAGKATFLFSNETGELAYDADGAGGEAAVVIARLVGLNGFTILNHDDFILI